MVALEFSDEIAWGENPSAGFVTHRWASLERMSTFGCRGLRVGFLKEAL
jgi:hypothetical protein